MSYIVGQKITRFWNGERYVFEVTDNMHWKCVQQDTPFIPWTIINDLPKLKG